jgi:sulfate/thiosulfate transport system permease protein
VLPGFGLSLGITMFALSAIVLIPLSAAVFKAAGLGWEGFWHAISSARALAAFRVSISTSFYAAAFDLFAGLLVAWVLVRYRFPGRRFFDAIVDLPFALPTAVAGIALTALYAKNGWVGKHLYAWGIESAFSPLGITIALTFIGLPFVVRSVQPVLADFEPEFEEAAATLGASRLATFGRVILPELTPALLTGFTMAFARALGEYGSVVFISGNMPMKTEILPLLIITQLEQFQYAQATALGTAMLALSFVFLLVINSLQRWSLSRRGALAV